MADKKKTAHVLVVDDEPDLRELLVDALSDDDVVVHVAASGDEAMSIAADHTPDLVIADLDLGGSWGTDVIDRLRSAIGDVPTVVITGRTDPKSFTDASRSGLVEMMSKPLDIERLRRTLRRELARAARGKRNKLRHKRLRHLARHVNIERKLVQGQLDSACEDLTSAYRTLSGQMSLQQVVIGYQNDLVAARNDDDVFRSLFQLFVKRTGPVFGMALICDAEAELRIAGRFGVPYPDKAGFCTRLSAPLVEQMLAEPGCVIIDALEEKDTFDEQIHKFLPGMTVMTMPLMPSPGELIGLVVLYCKGEQPFTDVDVALAEVLAHPTALAVQRNE